MRFTYCGEVVPSYIPTAIYEGWRDRRVNGLLFREQLYRSLHRRALWRCGWMAAFVLGYPPRAYQKGAR